MARLDPHSYTDIDQGVITNLDLRIKVDFDKRQLEGTAILKLDNAHKGILDLDTRDLTINEIQLDNGEQLKWDLKQREGFMGSLLRIELPQDCKEIIIQYHTSSQSEALLWLNPQQTAGKTYPYLFSQAQPIYARAIVPIQDSPQVRFRYNANVMVPKGLTAVMSSAPGEEKESKDKNFSLLQFTMPQAIPSYLLALVVGNLVSKDLGPRSRVYAEPEFIDAAAWEFANVDSMLIAAEELFGPYQWERFDFIVMPPAFPYGGMENPRLTFLTPTLLAKDRSLVNVLAHELAHSWTGNLVTNATMEDFWLNEGFTVWAERRILEKLVGKDACALACAIGYNGLMEDINRFGDDSPYTCLKTNLSGIDPDEIYSVVPYEKGFLFVSLLEKAVGREKFDLFIRDYIETYRFTSISTEQFTSFLFEKLPDIKTKVDIDSWIYNPGIPQSAPTFQCEILERTQKLANSWKTGVRPDPKDAQKWASEIWQIYLKMLPKEIPSDECVWLDKNFNLNESKNSEILCSWLTIAANSTYEPAFKYIDLFLGSMGRMKYLKPLYSALHKKEGTRSFAKQIFNKYSDTYHPIAQAAIERILGIV